MLLKPHDKILEVLPLQVLDERLSSYHEMKETVQRDYKIKLAEIRGEEQIDYPLGFLNEEEYLILHNLRIPDEVGFFQIDTLVLYMSYIVILESKNWYGTLLFDRNGNVIRIGDDGKEEGFQNPVIQAKMQRHRLQKWLSKHGFHNIPIKYFVVISFSNTIIKPISPNEQIPNKVIYSNEAYLKIKNLKKSHMESNLDMNKLMWIANQLIKEHTPPKKNLLTKYHINPKDIQIGVRCQKCQSFYMERRKQKWFCAHCEHSSTDAHHRSLLEYKLLFGNSITNKQARHFLQVESTNIVKRLIQNAGCKTLGTKKGTYYLIEGTTIDAQVNNFSANKVIR